MGINRAYGSSSYKQAGNSEWQYKKFYIKNVYVYSMYMDRDFLQITRLWYTPWEQESCLPCLPLNPVPGTVGHQKNTNWINKQINEVKEI